jgi:DNA-binding CsgD family transcriptional regulator
VTGGGLAGKPLSDREMEVLLGVAEGLPDIKIAGLLFISPATVKGHIGRIREKLGAASRPHMVAIAYHRGILLVSAGASL